MSIMRGRSLRIWGAPLALCVCGGVSAQQYRSEVRELPNPPAEERQSAEALLKQTTDPYQRALLLRELAVKAAKAGNHQRAAELLSQALETNALSGPAAEQMREMLGQVLMAGGDFKRNQPALEAQVRRGNAPPEIRVALAAAYLQDRRHADAIPLLRSAIDAVENADISWRRALMGAYLATNQFKAALPLLERLVREAPEARDDWARLAAVYLRVGNKPRAAATLELAQRLGYMNEASDRLRLVGLAAELGAPFEAASLLQGWMDKRQLPNDRGNRRLLAQLFVAAREAQLALPAISRALKDGPDAELLRVQAQLQMENERYGEAAESIKQLIALEGPEPDSLMSLATAQYQQANVDDALANFRRAAAAPGQQAELAREWVKYLESGRARELAMTAAAERREREAGDVRLASRIGTGDGAIPTRANRPAAGADAAGQSGGGRFTPVGAERAGNASGEIPAWTGGITPDRRPAGFVKGKALPDPYADDAPLFVITADNMAQHAQRLTRSHQHLLKKVPGYRLPVYPTRRSVSYPSAIYQATAKNAETAKLESPDALKDARLGFPFPQPSSGVEIMWNHRTRYRGDTVNLENEQAVVQKSGSFSSEHTQVFRVNFRYANIRDTADPETENYVAMGITHIAPPGRMPDVVALFHETLDSERQPRNIWVLLAAAGRMFRVPPLGYDQPFPGSDGLEFIDMVDMYNGAFDRYVWKLEGKREMYIPYNAYRLHLPPLKNEDLLQPLALDPEHTRYELHRVWVIEATERGGARHSFGKRVFYVDEDSWTVVMVENHDRKGNLWRFQEGHLVAEYDVQAAWTRPVITYDLKDGRYFANRLFAESPHIEYGGKFGTNEFLPASVRRTYSR